MRPSTGDTSDSVTSSSSLLPVRGDEENNLIGIISGVIGAVIVLVLILIVGVMTLLILRKKRKGSVNLHLDTNGTAHNNPVYQSGPVIKGEPDLDVVLTNPIYGGNIDY